MGPAAWVAGSYYLPPDDDRIASGRNQTGKTKMTSELRTPAEWAAKMESIKVGDEVVLFYAGRPCQHNRQNNPDHPCRGIVLKRGPKLLHIQSNGAPWKVRHDGETLCTALLLPDAKEQYLVKLMCDREVCTEEATAFVKQCIESL